MDYFNMAADLFSARPVPQNTPDMHRANDPQTSIDASETVARFKNDLQRDVYQALRTGGAMTDGELESLPQFAIYGPSTVRKRRSELKETGFVVDTGDRRDRMTVWRAVVKA